MISRGCYHSSVLPLLLALTLPASASSLRPVARQLAARADSARPLRVAVLPFTPSDASPAGDGRVIAERLLVEVVRAGGVVAVERSRLSGLLEEHSLGLTGVMDPASLRRIGRILSADAVIMGTFTSLRDRVAVSARLVDAETGAITAAAEGRLERDWTSTAPMGCTDAAARVDALERSILEPKARLWARRLREGFSFADAPRTPGADITDPQLRWEFYDRVGELYARNDRSELRTEELVRVESVERDALALVTECLVKRL